MTPAASWGARHDLYVTYDSPGVGANITSRCKNTSSSLVIFVTKEDVLTTAKLQVQKTPTLSSSADPVAAADTFLITDAHARIDVVCLFEVQ
jgi:hypothetical protein